MEQREPIGKGGKRRGAGRPPEHLEGRTAVLTATVPEVLVSELMRIAGQYNMNKSKAVTEAVRQYVARERKKRQAKP